MSASELSACPRCGRTGEHDCILRDPDESITREEVERTLEEFESKFNLKVRDLEKTVEPLQRNRAAHFPVDEQRTVTCRCGHVSFSLSEHNQHAKEQE